MYWGYVGVVLGVDKDYIGFKGYNKKKNMETTMLISENPAFVVEL